MDEDSENILVIKRKTTNRATLMKYAIKVFHVIKSL